MLGQIRQDMTTGWQTAEHPDEGIRLRDEAEHVLFFLTDVLYRMVPPFYENLESALAATFPERGLNVRVPTIVKFGSWVGGDMDGNPHVTAKSIRETLARQRALALEHYYRECHDLAGHLSQSATRVGVAEELERRTQLYAGHFQEAASSLPARHRRMPYRAFLRLVGARLQATYRRRRVPVRVFRRARRRSRSDRRQPAREQGPPRRTVRRAAAAAASADVRLLHRGARHSSERARASARDRRGAAGEQLARARRRRARASARRGARATRVAARRAIDRRAAHARDLPDDRALPAQVRARRDRRVHREHGPRRRRRALGAAAREMGAPRAERRGRAARHRAAVRDRRGRRARARDHGQAARRPALSRASARARQSTGRDARLRRQPSRRRLRGGALEPTRGAGSAR